MKAKPVTAKLLIEAVLEYDSDVMVGTPIDPESFAWFLNELLDGDLVLHSNGIGDAMGTLRVTRVTQITDSGPKGGQAGHAMSRRGAEPQAGRPTAVASLSPVGSAAADPPRDPALSSHGDPCLRGKAALGQ